MESRLSFGGFCLVFFITASPINSAPVLGSCLCFTGNSVNVRSSACGGRIGSAYSGNCFRSLGSEVSCVLGTTRYGFWNFDYNGRTGWAAKNYLRVSSSSDCNSAPPPGSCLCFTGSGVNVRSTGCGSKIGSANQGSCYKSLGAEVSCVLGTSTYDFWKINYNGRTGWAAKNYLLPSPSNSCPSVSSPSPTGCSGLSTVLRSSWEALPPTGTTALRHPTPRVFVHHTAAATHVCTTRTSCNRIVRNIQNHHRNEGWGDIGYNFLISASGLVYEGRGWDREGVQARGWNSVSVGISMMGDFTSSLPTTAALSALNILIRCGVQRRKLSSSYRLHGHRDGVQTACPGNRLYSYVKTMYRYSNI